MIENLMNDIFLESATIGVVISLIAYELGAFLKRKLKHDIFNPLLISIIVTIVYLIVFHVDYEAYEKSAAYISYFLTPATICLAIPLYQKLALLKENVWAILLSILSGVLTSLITILALSAVFCLTHEQYVTLLPKSITTAIGMGFSEEQGGIVTITVATIIITGVLGNMTAKSVCRIARIKSPISRGLAIGTSSHAIGTAKAMELGEVEGAMSSLSIVVAGLMTIVAASFFAMIY